MQGGGTSCGLHSAERCIPGSLSQLMIEGGREGGVGGGSITAWPREMTQGS